MSNVDDFRQRRADYWKEQRRSASGIAELTPNGAARSQPFGAQFRTANVEHNGQSKRLLTGYASMVERGYPMHDIFGEYTEIVERGAFERTLSDSPDVAYLVNHRGVTMARTTNGTLELSADETGLLTKAYLNPKRNDVNDLILAIEDKDVTEMSFAFMITDGQWDEDFSTFRIKSVDLNRGDVSAVNYGANPYTSVAARQQEIIQDFSRIPKGAQEAAMREAGIVSEIEERKGSEPTTDSYTLYIEQWLTEQKLSWQ